MKYFYLAPQCFFFFLYNVRRLSRLLTNFITIFFLIFVFSCSFQCSFFFLRCYIPVVLWRHPFFFSLSVLPFLAGKPGKSIFVRTLFSFLFFFFSSSLTSKKNHENLIYLIRTFLNFNYLIHSPNSSELYLVGCHHVDGNYFK